MNILVCSAGKHVELIMNIKQTLAGQSKVIATAHKEYIPALYAADRGYIVSDVTSADYIDEILHICEKEEIGVVLTMLDVETKVLAAARKRFEERNIMLLVPEEETAEICFDKYKMFKHLQACNIKTIATYSCFDTFKMDYDAEKICFPVFVKPNTGRGSVGARKIFCLEELKNVMEKESDLIIQEFINGEDIDIDIYVDTILKKPVSIFCKSKIESKIGGTSKSVSFIDKNLIIYAESVLNTLDFYGPLDMEVFKVGTEYYLTEINPRFSAAYVQAYSCGVDFVKLICNNYAGIANETTYPDYKAGNIMIKYESHLSLDEEDKNRVFFSGDKQ